MKDLIMTVNVPFCTSKCGFCTKNVSVCPKQKRDAYFEALLRELDSVSDELAEGRLRTLYLTGGTPTILAERQLPELVREIKKRALPAEDLEITVATNPGCLGINVLSRLKDHGLSRVEFSLCSADPMEQDILGRIFGEEDMYVSRQILEFGQEESFSVDILRGQPGQGRANMRSLLESVFRFAPPAAAMYPLRYSDNTPLHRKLSYRDGKTIPNVFYRALPDEGSQLDTFYLAEELLQAEGYRPYTVYHYAKPGCESLHHRLARTETDRLELGLGGITVSGGMLVRNTDDLDTYIRYAGDPARVLTEVRELCPRERMRGYIIGQLSLLKDFSADECSERFGCAPPYNTLEDLHKRGRLAEQGGRWRLTDAGRCFAQEVFTSF